MNAIEPPQARFVQRDMRALVTGAAGFVGRWLTDAMRREGIAVTAMAVAGTDRRGEHDRRDPAPVAPIDWHYGDLRDDEYVRRAVNAARPDFVVHLAAISHLPTAAADPAGAWDVNVTASARLLHHLVGARASGECDPLVLVVGSAEQYGRHPHEALPLTEDAPQYPRTVYAATKAAQEIQALQVWRATGLRVVAARSFNHSGAGQEERFLLPALVARAVALRAAAPDTPMIVGNTSPIRDFLHVSDVAAAYISLCKGGSPGESYNVASGVGRSVRMVAEQVLARAGVVAPLSESLALQRPVDVPALVGNSHKLQLTTGWRVTRSFDDIIDDLLHAATR